MNQRSHRTQPDLAAAPHRSSRYAVWAACIAAVVVVAMLGVRPITSEDLGCHVAYGEAFWRKGRIVDYNDFLYTLPSADVPPDQRPAPMAGGWYDEQGRCRFPNANWLTQVLFGGVWLIGGFTGLNVLLMLMVWAFFALAALLMRRLGVGPLGLAFGLILVGLVSFLRFTLRPELPGYLALLAQAALLAPLTRELTTTRVRPSRLVGLVVLQWVLANVHSYFYIGLGLTGAVAVDALARWVWAAFVENRPDTQVLGHNARWLTIGLAAQVAVCFINPWTWRLVLLPIQTFSYLSEQNVASGAGSSPWALLSETEQTFMGASHVTYAVKHFLRRGFRGDWLRTTYLLALLVSAAGGVRVLWNRRWSQALWLAAGMYLSLSMVRNVAIGTLLMLSVGLSAWREVLAATSAYITAKTGQLLAIAASVIVLAICAFLGIWIATSRIYQPQLQLRFGMGVSRVMVPLGPAEWLNENAPKGRIWTDFISSSNLYFLLEPPRDVPLITNGWAYPPAVMEEVIDVYRNTATGSAVDNLNAAADRYGMTTLLVRTDRGMQVWSQLAGSTDWSLVYLDGAYAILMRRTGDDAELARQAKIQSADWDADAYVAHAKQVEFRPAHALDAVGRSISSWGWDDQAIRLLTEAVAVDPRSEIAWRSLGLAQATRALHRHERRDRGAIDDFTSSAESLAHSLELEPDPRVAQARKRVVQQIRQMRLLYPTPPAP